MKKLSIIFLLSIVSCIEYSCSKHTATSFQLNKGEILVGKYSANGTHSVDVDQAILMEQIGKKHEVSKIDYVKSYTNENNLTVIEFAGPHNNGKQYITLAKVITVRKGNLILNLSAGCTQKCTTQGCCSGCSLTALSDCSGSCTCSGTSSCNYGKSGCTHEVSSGGGLY